MKTNAKNKRLWMTLLALVSLASLTACNKKDSSAPSAGGGVSTERNVLTMQGAAR